MPRTGQQWAGIYAGTYEDGKPCRVSVASVGNWYNAGDKDMFQATLWAGTLGKIADQKNVRQISFGQSSLGGDSTPLPTHPTMAELAARRGRGFLPSPMLRSNKSTSTELDMTISRLHYEYDLPAERYLKDGELKRKVKGDDRVHLVDQDVHLSGKIENDVLSSLSIQTDQYLSSALPRDTKYSEGGSLSASDYKNWQSNPPTLSERRLAPKTEQSGDKDAAAQTCLHLIKLGDTQAVAAEEEKRRGLDQDSGSGRAAGPRTQEEVPSPSNSGHGH